MKEHPDIVEFCHFPAYVRTRTAKPPVNKKRTRTLSHRESGSYDLGRHSYGSWNRGLSDSPTGLIAYSADLRRQSRPVRVLHRPPQKSSDICLRIFCLVDTGLEQGGPTGCGSQHLLRPLSGPCILLAAAPTAPPCFCRWQRSSLLLFESARSMSPALSQNKNLSVLVYVEAFWWSEAT